ncbi:hypothetical protein EC973_008809 [Apophysomyces ossiformis]|uniref:Methyltransferase type 11 domain-containing protein n=1 Tax=Apophysomyces ossiformis TaxID=679940 RepID=A0A8H7BSH0_9FUNG|nr:hypothetical protein EC973_008809 [Apophysomyces ossiformis]
MGNSFSSSHHRMSTTTQSSFPTTTSSFPLGSSSVPKYLKPTRKQDRKARKKLQEQRQKSKTESPPKKDRSRLEFNFPGDISAPPIPDDRHRYVGGRKYFNAEVVDMAMEFPDAHFIGIDIYDNFLADLQLPGLSRQRIWQDGHQPAYLPKIGIRQRGDDLHTSESHIDFEVGNILHGLPYPDNTFTLVHMRQMILSIPLVHWKQLLRELVRVTKPGGYIQLVEADVDPVMPQQPPIVNKTINAFRQRGLEPNIATRLDEFLHCVGFEEIDSKYVSMPVGNWGLEIGALWQQNLEVLVKSLQPQLGPVLHYDEEQWDALWKEAIAQLVAQRAFHNIHASWGRKPVTCTESHWESCSLFSQASSFISENNSTAITTTTTSTSISHTVSEGGAV